MKVTVGNLGATQIQSVSRAAKLLLWVASQAEGSTAKEAANAAGLALPTAYHLLGTLVAEGLLAKDARRRYELGPAAGVVAAAYQRQAAIPAHLLEPLHYLAEISGETAYVAAWRGREIHMLGNMESRSALRVGWTQVGAYKHPHARAVGKVLLAFAPRALSEWYLSHFPPKPITDHTIWRLESLLVELDRVRDQGFARDEQEFIEGVSCVAAPVLRDGILLAAYGLSVPSERFKRNEAALTAAVIEATHMVGNRNPEVLSA
jgi:IclR family transcriptional regulator, acetate operon repressor